MNLGSPELNAVSRAIGELRRGMPVVLDGGDAALLVVAAESGGDPNALQGLGGQAVSLLIPGSRAEALGLNPARSAVVSVAPDAGLAIDTVAALIGETSDGPLPGAIHIADASGRMALAAVELVKLARLLPAALTTPVTGDAAAFARREGLLTVAPGDIGHYRRAASALSVSEISAQVPLDGAENTRMVAFRPADGGKAHFAIVIGDPDPNTSVLARLHSECFTGDLLGSLRCDCGDQLRGAVAAIAAADDGGVLLYLAQEGRGIGLTNKLRAYHLQDNGFDTIEANEALGFGADERVYAPAAQILQRLGYTRIRLMTNNPAKVSALADHGIEVTARIPHAFPSNGHNEQYLQTKAARGGHLF